MRIYVLTETVVSFQDTFKVGTFAQKGEAEAEMERLNTKNNPPDEDLEDPRQYSFYYEIHERELIE